MKIKGKKMINQKFAFPTKFRAGIAGHKWERSCYCQPFGRNLNNNPPRHASFLPTWIKKKGGRECGDQYFKQKKKRGEIKFHISKRVGIGTSLQRESLKILWLPQLEIDSFKTDFGIGKKVGTSSNF